MPLTSTLTTSPPVWSWAAWNNGGISLLTFRAVFCIFEASKYQFLEDKNEGKALGRSGYGETGKK
jgi:hypothetical protein